MVNIANNINCTDLPYYVNYRHRAELVQPGQISPVFHFHDDCELLFFISGDVNFIVEGTLYNMKPGDVLITKPNELHLFYNKSETVYERFYIYFNPILLEKMHLVETRKLINCFINRKTGQRNILEFSGNKYDKLHKLFLDIDNLFLAGPPSCWRSLAFFRFLEILVLINQAYVSTDSDTPRTSDIPPILKDIFKYINNNVSGDLSVKTLSRIFGISSNYLPHLFRRYAGTNIHEYIITKRITKSKILLSAGKSVTETADACGYNDYSHFITAFTKAVGMSPLKYKKYIQSQYSQTM